MKYILRGFWSAAALAAVFGCGRLSEEMDVPGMPGEVRFDVSAGYEPETRTAFSGEVSGDTRTFERIDWVTGDCIAICSAEAETAAGAHAADYAVTASSADGVRSLAAVKSDDPLFWGEGTNTFYALYPAPGSDGAPAALTLAPGTVSADIPATQALTASGSVWQPDMHYAYMAAVAKVDSPSVPGPVSLVFKPLVTTYEISLKNFADDPVDSDLQVVRLRSTADGARLSGGFTATLRADGSYTAEPSGEGTDAVSASFPEGTSLSTTNALKLTLFTLPVNQADLQLELEFANGLVRRLPLADGGAPITVSAGEKIYLDNLIVPNSWLYHIDSSTPPVITSYEGGVSDFTLRSYRTKRDVTENVNWTATFSTSPDGPFTSTPPAGFTLNSSSGDGSEISISVSVGEQTGTPVVVDLTPPHRARFAANSASPYGTHDHPFDLSMHSLITGASRSAGEPVTANSYVVDRAGWYMFPLVYGNAIDYTIAADATSAQGGNTRAYMPGTQSDGTNFMTPFQNAAGVGMVSPYILDDLTACGLVDAATLAAHDLDAVIVWQDVASGKEIVTHPEILWTKPDASNAESGLPCPYIRFQAFENATNYAQGNALIALRDISAAANKSNVLPAEATILWSWHIWLTDTAFPADLKKTEVRASCFSKTFNWMSADELGYCAPTYRTDLIFEPRSLYVKLTQSSGDYRIICVEQRPDPVSITVAGSNPYYEFGRKDPLLPADGTSDMRNKVFVSGAGYGIVDTENAVLSNCSESGPLTLDATSSLAIQYPYVHLNQGCTWIPGRTCFNFWNATNTSSTYAFSNTRAYTDMPVVKTVYDPCPPGFCVPHQNAFTFFTDNGRSVSDLFSDNGRLDPADTPGVDGIWFKCLNDPQGIFFPFTGGRGWEHSVLFEVKQDNNHAVCAVLYWGTMSFGCDAHGSLLHGNDYSLGQSVRPVVEEHMIASVSLGD